MTAVLSKATVTAVGLISKAFLNSGLCVVQVNGLETLVDALQSSNRNPNQGIVTVCNHISTLDDPVIWGVLPTRFYFHSRTTRWALGASEIMFTNPVFSTFFSLGQTLETFRGKGIYQEAVNTAIEKINQGNWVHFYGEGKVNQPNKYPRDNLGRASLPQFKWGVGRIIMEANITPKVIPMWLSGFDQLMPEARSFPFKYFPRPGARLSITFGDPIPASSILDTLGTTKGPSHLHISPALDGSHRLGEDSREIHTANTKDHLSTSLIRHKVTAVLHSHVEALGRSISGDLLGGSPRRS